MVQVDNTIGILIPGSADFPAQPICHPAHLRTRWVVFPIDAPNDRQ
jgi:hypothetical protein